MVQNGDHNMFYGALLVAHVLCASATSAHALLYKHEVRSAIGWIGLVWLSPLIGAGLYFGFGINRVARRAAKQHLSRAGSRALEGRSSCGQSRALHESMQRLCQVGEQLTGMRLVDGNSVEILENGDAAYPKMIAQIESAKRSVCLSTYIFRPDIVGDRFVKALGDAHNRGVEVRVLVDAVGSGFMLSRSLRQLRAMGVKVALFMVSDTFWRMFLINLRNHKKLLLIDGCRGYIGGLNLGSENVMWPSRKRQVNDIHFFLQGPIIEQLMVDFARDWAFASDEVLDGPCWFSGVAPAGDIECRAVSSGPDDNMGKIETLFSAALGTAREHVHIVTPYFLPDEKLSGALLLASLRGVKVEVIVPEKSDHRIMDWAMRSHLSFLQDHGFECYLTPSTFDHAKLMTVDGKWCAFGSPNWDARSLRLNFELLVECFSQKVVSEIDALIAERRERSKPLSFAALSRRSLPHKLRDSTARLFLPYL